MPEEKKISKPEDQMLRMWIRENHSVKFPMYFFWNLTLAEALEAMQRDEPQKLRSMTEAQIKEALRR